jgi:hypothetical protein
MPGSVCFVSGKQRDFDITVFASQFRFYQMRRSEVKTFLLEDLTLQLVNVQGNKCSRSNGLWLTLHSSLVHFYFVVVCRP